MDEIVFYKINPVYWQKADQSFKPQTKSDLVGLNINWVWYGYYFWNFFRIVKCVVGPKTIIKNWRVSKCLKFWFVENSPSKSVLSKTELVTSQNKYNKIDVAIWPFEKHVNCAKIHLSIGNQQKLCTLYTIFFWIGAAGIMLLEISIRSNNSITSSYRSPSIHHLSYTSFKCKYWIKWINENGHFDDCSSLPLQIFVWCECELF